MSKYTTKVVESLFASRGKIEMEVAWDFDDCIQYDIDSDDKDIKKKAKAFAKSGLTEGYFNENIEYFNDQLVMLISKLNLGFKPLIKGDFESRSVTLTLGESATFSDYLYLFSSGASDLNINEGSEVYIQCKLYFQFVGILFVTEDSEEYSADDWTVLTAIHRMNNYLPQLNSFKPIEVKKNSLYKSINGALVFIGAASSSSDEYLGELITRKSEKLYWRDQLEYSKDGRVIDLDVPDYLPHHPDSIFNLVKHIMTLDDEGPTWCFGSKNLD